MECMHGSWIHSSMDDGDGDGRLDPWKEGRKDGFVMYSLRMINTYAFLYLIFLSQPSFIVDGNMGDYRPFIIYCAHRFIT